LTIAALFDDRTPPYFTYSATIVVVIPTAT